MGTNHQFTAKELQRMNEGLPPWESMSFACGGWLQCYMFGVAKAMQMCKLDKGVRYFGCSAGALASVGLAIGANFDDAIRFCKDECVPLAYSHSAGLFRLADYVGESIDLNVYPLFDNLQPDVLNVAVTRLPFFQPEIISSFATKEDLKLALLASSAAFPFAPIRNMHGKWYIDGGLSNFQPVLNDETITVSPFYFSDCDIKPSRYIPLWWSFLPPGRPETIEWLYNLGFVDGVNYVRSRGIPVKSELLNQEEKITHEFNIRKQVSIHRFLGYDTKKLTNEYISFTMDFILLVLLIFVLKPIVLGLIYIELFARMFFLSMFTVIHSLWDISPRSLIRRLIIRPYLHFMLYFTGGLVAVPRNMPGQSVNVKRAKMMKDLWECVRCAGSLSLLMRFFSGPPSTAELRQHKKLAKNSLCYRIFHHII